FIFNGLRVGSVMVWVDTADGDLPTNYILTTNNALQSSNIIGGDEITASAFGFFEDPLLAVMRYITVTVDESTGKVTVRWATELEESNAGFFIYRSSVGGPAV